MGRLQDRRVWLLGGAVIALLVLAIAWLGFIGPELSSGDGLRKQAAATRQQNAVLAAQAGGLQAKSKHVETFTTALARALEALPPNSGLPAFTREITTHAAAAGVRVESVAVGGITAATTPATATTPTTASAPTGGTSASPAAGATPTAPTATTSSAGAVPATAGGGLYAISVTLQSTGSLHQQLAFLNRLRAIGPRTVLVTSAQFGAAGKSTAPSIDRTSTLSTQLSVFVAPQSPSQLVQLQKMLAGKIGN